MSAPSFSRPCFWRAARGFSIWAGRARAQAGLTSRTLSGGLSVLAIAIVYETAEPIYEWTLRRKAFRRMRSQPDDQPRAPSPT